MSTTTATQAHIAYELIDDSSRAARVVVIEFLSTEIVGGLHSRELSEQLESLIRSGLPRNYVIDFANIRLLGSTAFAEIVTFARHVGSVFVCNMQPNLRLGAAMIGLDDFAEFAGNRRGAIYAARKAALADDDDTIDRPPS